MSIVITPGTQRARGEPSPAGRLAGSLLSVTVAGLADPQRFRRGKTYLADQAVTRLEIAEGVLLAAVVGGRPDAYHVTVTVETVPSPPGLEGAPDRSHVARLIPRGEEILCSCTCPDWDDPCKHAVAALLAFAAELAHRPELLVAWRCDAGEEAATGRPAVGWRGRRQRHLRLVPPAAPQSPFDTPEWRSFVGEGLAVPHCVVPEEPLTVPVMRLDHGDVAAVIRSAWQTLARFSGESPEP